MVICSPEESPSPDKQTDKQTRKLGDKFETSNENIIRLINTIGENELSVKNILKAVGLKDRENFLFIE